MPLKFETRNGYVALIYKSSFSCNWIWEKFDLQFEYNYSQKAKEGGAKHLKEIKIKHIFFFQPEDVICLEADEDTAPFVLATVEGDFYRVLGRKLNIECDILLSRELNLFATGYERRTSIFKQLSRLLPDAHEEIVIGGKAPGSIPTDVFLELVDAFPNTSELKRIGDQMVAARIKEYVELKGDYESDYEKYVRRRYANQFKRNTLNTSLSAKLQLDSMKEALKELSDLLSQKVPEQTPEDIWQRKIIGILPIIFPQYIHIFPKVEIADVISGASKREIDYLLVDASGNVDVLEIKKAFQKNNLIMKTKYRDNYIPARELSGGAAQLEKYIYYLLNWGQRGEQKLTAQLHKQGLSPDLELRFLTPKGILLLGNCDLNQEEQRDFDIIRRQYNKVVDIITYNDLVGRLERMIESLEARIE